MSSRARPWPAAFERGLWYYWRGYYWHSHEAWEDVWRPAQEPIRSFMKALIQIDAALIHSARSEWRGVRNLLQRVLRYLDRCPPEIWGIDVRDLQRQVTYYLDAVEAISVGRRRRFPWHRKPRIYPPGLPRPRRERLRRHPKDTPMRVTWKSGPSSHRSPAGA